MKQVIGCYLDAFLMVVFVKILFPEITWGQDALSSTLLANVLLLHDDG